MSSAATRLVLFVEDEVLIQDLVETVLREGGFDVETVLTGSEAFETLGLRAADFAAVITDVNLPAGPNGWDVGRRARELVPDMPVVYVTGDSAHEWSSKGVPESVIVSKPFAPAQLVVAVATLLNAAHP